MPPTKRKTPQRTFALDDEPWDQALRIAGVRRETMAEVLRRAVMEYIERNRHLDPGKPDD